MSVPTKEDLEERQDAETEDLSELDPVQFSAQFSAVAVSVQEKPQPEAADAPETGQELLQQMEQAEQAQSVQTAQSVQSDMEEITRRDREILAALDEVLQKNSVHSREPRRRIRSPINFGRLAVGTVRKGAGYLSLALTLIFMGITLVCVMISPEPDYLLIAKLSPIAAVIVGVEMVLSWFVSGKRLRINIPCVCVIAVVVIGCCAMSAALNRSDIEGRTEYSGRVIEAEIYEASYKQLRHSADILELSVSTDLNPDSAGKSMETLSAGDRVEITAVFDGSYTNPREFAEECRRVIKAYQELKIPVMSFHFSAQTRLSSFRLDVDGLFQQDMTAEELTELVRHIYIEDYDYIHDLEDITEETSESTDELS